MNRKIVHSLHCTAIITLVIIIVLAFQPNLFGQDVSASKKEVWQMVESYWNIRKENSPAKIKPFYHNHYIHWGAAAGLPHTYSSFSPPSGQADALKGALDSYRLFPDKIRIHNNFAIAMYFNKIVNNGTTHRLQCTDVWMKESDKWQLVATIRDSCNDLPRCPEGVD